MSRREPVDQWQAWAGVVVTYCASAALVGLGVWLLSMAAR